MFSVLKVVNYLNDIVNGLTEAQRIDTSLQQQDEVDKEATKLYGYNQAAGKNDAHLNRCQCVQPSPIKLD